MFDIFEEKEAPKLYIADIVVEAKIPTRGKVVKYNKRIVRLENHPIVLLNGKPPTRNTEQSFLKKIYDDKISISEFNKVKMSIQSIENIRFSSNLMYKFDYNLH